MQDLAPQWARACWAAAEPFTIHPLFAPEQRAHFTSLGFRGLEPFLVARGAVLGQAHPAVVKAAFHGFPLVTMTTTFPAAWERISPVDAIAATHEVLGGVFGRLLADHPVRARAAALGERLWEVVGGLEISGRPLAAGNRAVPEPTEPWARLWRACTTLREYRGDGHVAVLTSADVDVTEAHVLAVRWDGSPVDEHMLRRSRGVDDTSWVNAHDRLRSRGLADGDDRLTTAGIALRQHIEDQTDQAAAGPFRQLGLTDVVEAHEVLAALSDVVLGQDWLPVVNAIGAPWPAPSVSR